MGDEESFLRLLAGHTILPKWVIREIAFGRIASLRTEAPGIGLWSVLLCYTRLSGEAIIVVFGQR